MNNKQMNFYWFPLQDGEERARLVWEKCQQFPELNPCTYPSESFMKQMLTVPSKKFVQCTPGKTGIK